MTFEFLAQCSLDGARIYDEQESVCREFCVHDGDECCKDGASSGAATALQYAAAH